MQRYSTAQLQQAMLGLFPRKDADSCAAYALAFEEVHRRMGDAEFDAWLDANGL